MTAFGAKRFNAAVAGWRVVPRPALTHAQHDWLTRGGSLTAHLARLGGVTLRVTRETVATPWADEHAALGSAARDAMWVREVVLEVDGTPFVAAHSLAPLASSKGVWQAMRLLRTRPLAELLYSDPRVTRSALASRRVGSGHPLFALASVAIGDESAHVRAADAACGVDAARAGAGVVCMPRIYVARRSVFVRHGAPLMVTECMLPALWRRLDVHGDGAYGDGRCGDRARPCAIVAA